MDPVKMKVVELRAELATRGLDQKGVKAVLVTRLQNALVIEGGGVPIPRNPDDSMLGDPTDDTSNTEGDDEPVDNPQPIARRRRTRSMTRSPSPVKNELEIRPLDTLNEEDADCVPPPRKIPTTPSRGTPAQRRRRSVRSTTRSPSPTKSSSVLPQPMDTLAEEEPPTSIDNGGADVAAATTSESTPEPTPAAAPIADAETAVPEDVAEAADGLDEDMPETEEPTSEEAAEPMDEDSAAAEDTLNVSGNGAKNEQEATLGDEADTPAATKSEESKDAENTESGTDQSASNPSASAAATPDTKKKRGVVSLKKPERSKEARVATFTSVENEPELPDGIHLSWVDSDLHLQIDETANFLAAKPIQEPHLLSSYSGCRATHGVRTGRVAYEVHMSNIIHVNMYDPPKYDIRVGWSTRSASLQLGEGQFSMAYTMQRKKALASVFTDYGMILRTGDVVGVYLDLESEPCRVEYTVNGKSQGVAFEFERSELGDAALFPHISAKCVAFRCNFSDSENLLVNSVQPEFTEPDEKHERRMIAPKQPRSHKQQSDKSRAAVTPAATPAKTEESDSKTDETPATDATATNDVENTDEAVKDENDAEENTPIEDVVEAEATVNDEVKVEDETKDEAEVEEPAAEEEKPADDEVQPAVEVEEKTAVDESEEPAAAVDGEPVDDQPSATAETNDGEDVTTAEAAPTKVEEPAAPVAERIVHALLPDYTLIGQLPADQLVAGPVRPAARQDCEVIMMIGVPSCGKTTWALNYAKENEDKNYYLLSQASIIDRTTLNGKPRFAPRSKNWEHSLKYYLRILERMYPLAQKRRRNYIIDEPNITFDEQNKRMKGFGDFTRIAVVVVPSKEDLKLRTEKKDQTDGRTYSRNHLADMKIHFELPDANCLFHEIRFSELDEAQSEEMLHEYYKEGQQFKSSNDHRDRFMEKSRQRAPAHHQNWQGGGGGGGGGGHRGGPGNYRHGGGNGPRDDHRSHQPYWRGGGGGGGGGNRHYGGGGGYDQPRERWGGGGGGGGGNRNWVLNNHRGGGGGGGGGNRYDDRGGYRGAQAAVGSGGGGYQQRRDFNQGGGGGGGGGYNNGGGGYNNYRGGGAADRRDDRSYRGGAGGGGHRDRDFRDGNRDRHTGGDRHKNDRGVPHFNVKDDKTTKNYGSTNHWNNQQGGQQGSWNDWSSYNHQHQQPQNYYGQQQQQHQQPQHQQQSTWQAHTAHTSDNQQYWSSDNSWQQPSGGAGASVTDQSQQQGWQNWSQYAQTYGNVDPNAAYSAKK